jgi:hypothetical protein
LRIEKTSVSAKNLDSRLRGNDTDPYLQQTLYKGLRPDIAGADGVLMMTYFEFDAFWISKFPLLPAP